MAPHLPHPHLHAHSPPKGARYASTLDLARRLALFTHPTPAVAKGALNPAAVQQLGEGEAVAAAGRDSEGMQWGELLRKFRKHNPGREVTASAAQAEQLLHTHLSQRSAALASSLSFSASDTPPSLPPLVPTSHRAAVLPALEALAAALSGAHAGVEVDSARAVLAWGRYVVGEPDEARPVLAMMQGRGLPAQGEGWEGYDLTLRVLASAVEGYLAEDAGTPETAIAAYEGAATLYTQALSQLGSGAGGKDDISLHRIGGHALFRLCVLDPSSTAAHTQYLERSGAFPHGAVAFPAAERLWVHRALRRLASGGSANEVGAGVLARSNRAEEALIRRGTSLPPAGETNAVYLRFLDEVVGAWRARGARRDEAGEVIETLYAALTHTFQSHLLLRHLVRALAIAGRHTEAAKALKLYRDLWDKARETDAAEVAREMRVLRARAWREAQGEKGEKAARVGEGEGEDRQESREGPYDSDIDSDAVFTDTALFGVRLLCRQVDAPGEAVELARRVRAVFDEGKDAALRGDKDAEARIETALGVALGALAAKEANRDHRPAQHEEALTHLTAAASLSAASSHAHYALAYQLLELRQVSRALEAARAAVERNKRSREAWHLLALCVSAQKDMRGALEVLETALDIVEDTESAEDRWGCPTDETDRLAVETQLRLTRNVVIEYLEGAPAALTDQQDVLTSFAAAYSRTSDVPLVQAPATTTAAPKTASGLAPPVPSVNGGGDGTSKVARAASIVSRRRSIKRQSVALNGAGPPESVNASLANLSISNGSTPSVGRAAPEGNTRATKLLVDAWLASAASFRRAGRHDEARGALGEAEALDADDPDVWSQTALLLLARGEVARARDAATKALSFDPAHVPSLVALARVYLTAPAPGAPDGAAVYSAAPPPPPSHLTSPIPPPAHPAGGLAFSLPLAETLLTTLTAHGGWDVPEAWAELARCYRLSAPPRRERERECLVWALQLEETRAVRPLAKAVGRAL